MNDVEKYFALVFSRDVVEKKYEKTTIPWQKNAEPKMLWEPACMLGRRMHLGVAGSKFDRISTLDVELKARSSWSRKPEFQSIHKSIRHVPEGRFEGFPWA